MVKTARFLKFVKAVWPLATLPKKSRTIARIINLLGNNKITDRFLSSRILPHIPDFFVGILKDLPIDTAGNLLEFVKGGTESSLRDDMIVYSLTKDEACITINETIEKPPDTILPNEILDNIIDKAEHF